MASTDTASYGFNVLRRDPPPYGWRLMGGDVVADAVEHLVIARMRAWYSEGLTHGSIARRLNAERTPGRYGRWTAREVATLLDA
jgi:hypothetical protein